MKTTFYICRDCSSEFEMLDLKNLEISCIMCNSTNVRERKNAKMNCMICCSHCDEKETCEAWKD